MNYNDKYELIYYAPMRTGTRSIYTILKKIGFVCNSNDYNTHDHSIPSVKVDEDITKTHYKTICSVRNPYSRTVSNWNLYRLHYKVPNFPFEEFVNGTFITKDIDYQVNYHEGLKDNPPNYIIRTEYIYEDILKIPGILDNIDSIKEELDNQMNKNHYHVLRTDPSDDSPDYWKIFYNENLANIVYDGLKEQFGMFGYDKDSWRP